MDVNHGNDSGDDGDHELLSISAAIRAALGKGIDPYTVAEVLAEGTVFAVEHIPAEQREKAATALILMLHERLKAHGAG